MADACCTTRPKAFHDAAREQLEGRQLAHDAVRLLRAGVTSVAEAMRVTALTVEAS